MGIATRHTFVGGHTLHLLHWISASLGKATTPSLDGPTSSIAKHFRHSIGIANTFITKYWYCQSFSIVNSTVCDSKLICLQPFQLYPDLYTSIAFSASTR